MTAAEEKVIHVRLDGTSQDITMQDLFQEDAQQALGLENLDLGTFAPTANQVKRAVCMYLDKAPEALENYVVEFSSKGIDVRPQAVFGIAL